MKRMIINYKTTEEKNIPNSPELLQRNSNAFWAELRLLAYIENVLSCIHLSLTSGLYKMERLFFSFF